MIFLIFFLLPPPMFQVTSCQTKQPTLTCPRLLQDFTPSQEISPWSVAWEKSVHPVTSSAWSTLISLCQQQLLLGFALQDKEKEKQKQRAGPWHTVMTSITCMARLLLHLSLPTPVAGTCTMSSQQGAS